MDFGTPIFAWMTEIEKGHQIFLLKSAYSFGEKYNSTWFKQFLY